MPLIDCPDCGKQVSDHATSCIECGRPLHVDLLSRPAAGSDEAVKTGRQRSKLRNDLGNALGLFGVGGAIVAGTMSGSFALGIVLALVALGLAIYVAYGY